MPKWANYLVTTLTITIITIITHYITLTNTIKSSNGRALMVVAVYKTQYKYP